MKLVFDTKNSIDTNTNFLLDTEKYPIVDSLDNLVEVKDGHINGLENLKVGDLVEVSYYPYSQRYVNMYKSFRGRVISVDVENSDALFYSDKLIVTKKRKRTNEYTRTVHSLDRNGCSYLGLEKGYMCSICRIENTEETANALGSTESDVYKVVYK